MPVLMPVVKFFLRRELPAPGTKGGLFCICVESMNLTWLDCWLMIEARIHRESARARGWGWVPTRSTVNRVRFFHFFHIWGDKEWLGSNSNSKFISKFEETRSEEVLTLNLSDSLSWRRWNWIEDAQRIEDLNWTLNWELNIEFWIFRHRHILGRVTSVVL